MSKSGFYAGKSAQKAMFRMEVALRCNQKAASVVEAAFLKSCQGVDSDHRPKAYESSALPLSYPGDY